MCDAVIVYRSCILVGCISPYLHGRQLPLSPATLHQTCNLGCSLPLTVFCRHTMLLARLLAALIRSELLQCCVRWRMSMQCSALAGLGKTKAHGLRRFFVRHAAELVVASKWAHAASFIQDTE